ncbi:MAG: CHAT domain-containing protein [Chloroflexi bacterium]|nr:CHAT domain-containing protein [Chloroflexota bacterium]MBM4451277.1 CHAT domain-containing protein [Chloroflexota bacterium]
MELKPNKRVLVVEDAPNWRKLIGELLQEVASALDCTIEVVIASCFEEALSKIATMPYDCFTIDNKLPDGHRAKLLLDRIARLAPRVPVVVISGEVKPSDVRDFFRDYEIDEFFWKREFDPKKFKQRLTELLAPGEKIKGSMHQERSADNQKKLQRRLFLRYNCARQLLSVAIEDAERTIRFSADSDRQLNFDIEAFTVRADEARRSPKWRALIKGVGQDLYARLFADHPVVIEAYNRAMGMVDNRDEALSIVFSSTRDTLRLPVEFLNDGRDYLCLKHPFSRYLQEVHSRAPLKTYIASEKKLNLLIVASNTGGIPGVDEEIATLRKALSQMLSAKGIDHQIVALPTAKATYERVNNQLEQGGYHIWHYAGHGFYDMNSPELSHLVFWSQKDAQGERLFLTASDLQSIVNNTQLCLVYLSCCLGSAAGGPTELYEDDFLGLAEALAQARVNAIVGFRWPVSDVGAVALAQTFYSALVDGFDPQRALWRARRAISRGPQKRDDPTWASPVLIEQS